MGKFSREKGARTERAIVRLLQDSYGLSAERVPLSGACGGKFKGDISVPVLGKDKTLEVKCRAGGFNQIYDWLDDNFGLVIKADHRPMLIVLRLTDAADVLKEAEGYRAQASVARLNFRAFGVPADDIDELLRRAG